MSQAAPLRRDGNGCHGARFLPRPGRTPSQDHRTRGDDGRRSGEHARAPGARAARPSRETARDAGRGGASLRGGLRVGARRGCSWREPGTGKELLARGIHYSARRTSVLPFDCAAVPAPLLAAELFGTHPPPMRERRRPRAAGASSWRRGTLFVSDVTRLPLPLQRRLAAAIRERPSSARAATRPCAWACRVIVSRIRPAGGYRSPPGTLDLELLAALSPARRRSPPAPRAPGRHPHPGRALPPWRPPPSADGDLTGPRRSPRWRRTPGRGNVRELRHVVERAAQLAGDEVIRAEHLIVLHRTARSGLSNQSSPRPPPSSTSPRGQDAGARGGEAVALTLGLTRGNRSAAARILGISRPTLARKLREQGRGGEWEWEWAKSGSALVPAVSALESPWGTRIIPRLQFVILSDWALRCRSRRLHAVSARSRRDR
jgi:hypothetical protein